MTGRGTTCSRRVQLSAWALRAAVLCAVSLTGCASYQFQIVQPSEHAGPVSSSEATVIPVDPLEYHLLDARGRLGVRIYNRTDETITLLGERSYIVDPIGETRGVRGGSIAPQSRVTIMLPPDQFSTRAGPRLGVGIGVGTGFRSGYIGSGIYHDRWGDPYFGPRYTTDEPGWRWVTGTIRIRFVFDAAGEAVRHEFVIDRVRVR